jgi:hypothetical protein
MYRIGSDCNFEVINCQRNEYFTQWWKAFKVLCEIWTLDYRLVKKLLRTKIYFFGEQLQEHPKY